MQLPVTAWRLRTSPKADTGGYRADYPDGVSNPRYEYQYQSDNGTNVEDEEEGGPMGAVAFWQSCGMRGGVQDSSYKFRAVSVGDTVSAASAATGPWASLSASSAQRGVACARDCIPLLPARSTVQGGWLVSKETEKAFKSKAPIMMVTGWNKTGSAGSVPTHSRSQMTHYNSVDLSFGSEDSIPGYEPTYHLQKLSKLTAHNTLCLGDATNGIAETRKECHTLVLGGGSQSQSPPWSLGSCVNDLNGNFRKLGGDISTLLDQSGNQLFPSTGA